MTSLTSPIANRRFVRKNDKASDRIATATTIRKTLLSDKYEDLCNLADYFSNIFIGGGEYGQAFRLHCKKGHIPYAMVAKIADNCIGNRKEAMYLEWFQKGLAHNGIPHIPLLYDYRICDKPFFSQKKVLIIMELADGILKEWLQTRRSVAMLSGMVAQLIMACYLLELDQLEHCDLHWSNVFFRKDSENKGGYLHYFLEGRHIYVQHNGYFWMIGDFGMMQRMPSSHRLNDLYNIIHFPEWMREPPTLESPAIYPQKDISFRYLLKGNKSIQEMMERLEDHSFEPYIVVNPDKKWVSAQRIINKTPYVYHSGNTNCLTNKKCNNMNW